MPYLYRNVAYIAKITVNRFILHCNKFPTITLNTINKL